MEKSIIPFKNKDLREEFYAEIKNQGRQQKWIASKLGVTEGYITHLMKGRMPITEDMRKRLNELLNTSI